MSVFGSPTDEYTSIDRELDGWAPANGLQWAKEFKDESVRALNVASSSERSIQLYVELPQGSRFRVIAGQSYPRGSQRLEVTDRDLITALDVALAQAKHWADDQ